MLVFLKEKYEASGYTGSFYQKKSVSNVVNTRLIKGNYAYVLLMNSLSFCM